MKFVDGDAACSVVEIGVVAGSVLKADCTVVGATEANGTVAVATEADGIVVVASESGCSDVSAATDILLKWNHHHSIQCH